MARTTHELCGRAAADEAMELVGDLADCTLVAADGSSYEVSKAIIAMHSKVLGRMFRDIGHAEDCIRLDDSADEVACLMHYAYGGDSFQVSLDNLPECSRMAHKYDMPRLQRAVDAFVQQVDPSPQTLPSLIAIAHDSPEMHELKQRCIAYVASHLQTILNRRVFDKKHPTDWLEALPQATLVDLMLRRSAVAFGAGVMHVAPAAVVCVDDAQIAYLEAVLAYKFAAPAAAQPQPPGNNQWWVRGTGWMPAHPYLPQ